MRNTRESRNLHRFSALLACAAAGIALVLVPPRLSAQTTAPSPPNAPTQVNASSIGIGASLSAGSFLFMPQVSMLAEVSIPLRHSGIDIVPELGFTYLFFPMNGISGSLFLPVGVAATFNSYGLALFALHETDILHPLHDGIVTIGIEGFLTLASAHGRTLRLGVKAGTGIVWSTGYRPYFLVALSPSIGFLYRLHSSPAPK